MVIGKSLSLAARFGRESRPPTTAASPAVATPTALARPCRQACRRAQPNLLRHPSLRLRSAILDRDALLVTRLSLEHARPEQAAFRQGRLCGRQGLAGAPLGAGIRRRPRAAGSDGSDHAPRLCRPRMDELHSRAQGRAGDAVESGARHRLCHPGAEGRSLRRGAVRGRRHRRDRGAAHGARLAGDHCYGRADCCQLQRDGGHHAPLPAAGCRPRPRARCARPAGRRHGSRGGVCIPADRAPARRRRAHYGRPGAILAAVVRRRPDRHRRDDAAAAAAVGAMAGPCAPAAGFLDARGRAPRRRDRPDPVADSRYQEPPRRQVPVAALPPGRRRCRAPWHRRLLHCSGSHPARSRRAPAPARLQRRRVHAIPGGDAGADDVRPAGRRGRQRAPTCRSRRARGRGAAQGDAGRSRASRAHEYGERDGLRPGARDQPAAHRRPGAGPFRAGDPALARRRHAACRE